MPSQLKPLLVGLKSYPNPNLWPEPCGLRPRSRTRVIHRDLKPANLLIGGIHASPSTVTEMAARYGVVKVADFGLSRVTTLLKTGLGHELMSPAKSNSLCDSTSLQASTEALTLGR